MRLRCTPAILFSFCFLIANNVFANTNPIPIEANTNTTVTLFFPSTILKVIKPAANFSFDHEPNGNLATLKARKGNSSNLTVITKNGDVFSFVLNYSETVHNFAYVLSTEQAIGKRRGGAVKRTVANEKSLASANTVGSTSEDGTMGNYVAVSSNNPNLTFSDTVTAELATSEAIAIDSNEPDYNIGKEGSFYDLDREGYYQIFCENSYLQRTITKNNMAANSSIDLRINHMVVDHDEIYFTLQLRNISKSDYKIGKVQFYVKTIGSAALPMKPEYTFNQKELVKQSGVNKFVYVFKDFKLGPDQKVYVVMHEKEGIRKITLPLDIQTLKANLD